MGNTIQTNRQRSRMARVVLAIAVTGLFTGACEKKSGLLDPVAITITVTPNPQTLQVGATQQFTAVGRDFAGATVGITPVWSVVSGGGTISATGLFTAGTTLGTFASTIKATSGDVSGFATVTVTAAPLATITVTPNPATLAIGGLQQFTAVGRDVNGNVVAITPTWSVVNGGGAINASTGAFTAGMVAGTFANTVRATSGAISGTATVIVIPGPAATLVVTPNPVTLEAGATQQFTAVARDAGGNVVTVTPAWSVVNNGGTIVSGTGMFTAGNVAGTFANTVRATVGTLSATATVTVTPPPPPPVGALASITVTPNPGTMEVNSTTQFSAIGRDANGNIVSIVPTWVVVNGGGAIGANSGLFAAGNTAGTFNNTVRATSGTIQGFATVIVTSNTALVRIIVTPNPAVLGTGEQQQFAAVGENAQGNPVAITPVWSVVNGGGTINASGRFTAGLVAGTFNNTVRATSDGISGFATVQVVATPTPASIIPLGNAAPNGIMAGTAVTCVVGGIVNADVSISPGNTITGFGPCVITGVQHLADAVAANAQLDLTTAYNTGMGLPCPPANAIVANLGGTTKAAGVYCSATGIGVTGTLTLDGGGDPNATFVFQAGTSLTTAGSVVLINGAQAKNVFWLVGSSATIGTASQWKGNILALTSITLVDNANLIGRALARNGAVTLGTNNVITLP